MDLSRIRELINKNCDLPQAQASALLGAYDGLVAEMGQKETLLLNQKRETASLIMERDSVQEKLRDLEILRSEVVAVRRGIEEEIERRLETKTRNLQEISRVLVKERDEAKQWNTNLHLHYDELTKEANAREEKLLHLVRELQSLVEAQINPTILKRLNWKSRAGRVLAEVKAFISVDEKEDEGEKQYRCQTPESGV